MFYVQNSSRKKNPEKRTSNVVYIYPTEVQAEQKTET